MAGFTIKKINLGGKMNLIPTSATDYYLQVPTVSNSIIQPLSIKPLEEVFINTYQVDYTIRLFLPKISDFKGFWNTKIYIHGLDGAGVDIIPYADETTINTINNNSLIVSGVNCCLNVISENDWFAFGIIS